MMICAHREPLQELLAPAPSCGRRICAWCVPMRDLGPAPELPAGQETHGMCDPCYAREMVALALNCPEVRCFAPDGPAGGEAAMLAPIGPGESHAPLAETFSPKET
jgi:hypothetical protein